MELVILKIEKVYINEVMNALNSFNLKYEIAGDPNGKVTLIESFESSMNNKRKSGDNKKKEQYDKMNNYAVEKGYKDVTDAISKLGSPKIFIKKFKEEYNSLINTKVVTI